MRLLISGGGTGGHIYPALAIVRALKALDSDLQVLYVGTRRGLEADLVAREGLTFEAIDAAGVMRKAPWQAARGAWLTARGLGQSLGLVRRFHPDVAVGTGGYVSGPVILAARLLGVRTAIQEQNAIPGFTNRMLARLVDRVFLPFPEARRYFGRRTRTKVTGNPLRPEVLSTRAEDARRRLGIAASRQVLFVFGGSRGAQSIHRAMPEALAALLRRSSLLVLYVTGQAYHAEVLARLRERGLVREERGAAVRPGGEPRGELRVMPYLHEVADALAAADLAVVRAGAMTVSELLARGLPAIVVPSPNVANNHQEANARVLQRAGAAVVIRDARLTGPGLAAAVEELLDDPQRRARMAEAARVLGRPNAGHLIAQEILTLGRRTR